MQDFPLNTRVSVIFEERGGVPYDDARWTGVVVQVAIPPSNYRLVRLSDGHTRWYAAGQLQLPV